MGGLGTTPRHVFLNTTTSNTEGEHLVVINRNTPRVCKLIHTFVRIEFNRINHTLQISPVYRLSVAHRRKMGLRTVIEMNGVYKLDLSNHSLTSTNQISRKCPSPCYPSPQSADESQDALKFLISSTHRGQTPRSCCPRHAAGCKYELPSFTPADSLSCLRLSLSSSRLQ